MGLAKRSYVNRIKELILGSFGVGTRNYGYYSLNYRRAKQDALSRYRAYNTFVYYQDFISFHVLTIASDSQESCSSNYGGLGLFPTPDSVIPSPLRYEIGPVLYPGTRILFLETGRTTEGRQYICREPLPPIFVRFLRRSYDPSSSHATFLPDVDLPHKLEFCN
ncbi:hypothetical protein SK128_019938 [Halocaridina rubra]|uniref:Uncharacterized protein n=1 Tax=Halocaridina rubra TaxID=373956 RepID=A0AAN8WZD8_HALRR